jgi:hypothetical protein
MILRLNALQRAVWYGGRSLSLNEVGAWRVKGFFSLEQLRDALNCIREKQPFVAVRIHEDSSGEPFLTTEQVPDFQILEETAISDISWINAASAELGMPFEMTHGPLWRLRVLYGIGHIDLLVVGHHAFYDGLSVLTFMKNIMTALIGRSDDIPRQIAAPCLEDLVPNSLYLDRSVRLWLTLVAASAPLINCFFRMRRHHDHALPPDDQLRYRCSEGAFRIVNGELGAQATATLMSVCRLEGVSVHAAICTAWLRAFVRTTGAARCSKFRFSSPVSIRRLLLPPQEDTMGTFLSQILVRVRCDPARPFWETCREIQLQIKRGAAPARIFMPILLLPRLLKPVPKSRMPQLVERFVNRHVGQALDISNAGKLSFEHQYGNYQVESAYGIANVFAGDRTVVAQTFRGRMFMTLTFRDSIMDQIGAENMMAGSLAELESF